MQNSALLLFTMVTTTAFGMIFTNGKVFVSFDYDKYTPFIFSLTLADHSPNTMMINSLRRYSFWKTFIENFKLGNVYFESQKIKHNCYEAFMTYNNR